MVRFKVSSKQDEGWAWIVLGAATLNAFVALGVALGCGVYVTEVIHNWGVGKASGALVGSLLFGIFSSSGPLTTMLVCRTSHRTAIIFGGFLSSIGLVASANVNNIIGFYFTFSVLGGIGCGMVFLQSVILVNLYFRRYRGIAAGISIAGGGGGVLAMPLLQRFLIKHFSWQPSLYIIAGFCLNTCVLGALMRPIRLKLSTKVDLNSALGSSGYIKANSVKSQSLEKLQLHSEEGLSLFKNKTYICYAINNALWGLGCTVPIILGPDLYTEIGLVSSQGNILISCFGVGNILGRLVGGVLCNIRSLNRLTLYVILNILLGAFIALYTPADGFVLYSFASSGYGFIFGAFIVTQAVVTMDIVGRQKMEQAFSFAYFACSLGVIAGPPLSGTLFDLTKSYKWPYLIAAVVVSSSVIPLLPALFTHGECCCCCFCCSRGRSAATKTLAQIIIDDPAKLSDSVLLTDKENNLIRTNGGKPDGNQSINS